MAFLGDMINFRFQAQQPENGAAKVSEIAEGLKADQIRTQHPLEQLFPVRVAAK